MHCCLLMKVGEANKTLRDEQVIVEYRFVFCFQLLVEQYSVDQTSCLHGVEKTFSGPFAVLSVRSDSRLTK